MDLQNVREQVQSDSFDPSIPVHAMCAGIIDGDALRLPLARPFYFWQSSTPYAAGRRAGVTGDPTFICKLDERHEFYERIALDKNSPNAVWASIMFIDDVEISNYFPSELVSTLHRDPTVVSW